MIDLASDGQNWISTGLLDIPVKGLCLFSPWLCLLGFCLSACCCAVLPVLFLCLCPSGRFCHGATIGPRNEADRFRAASRNAFGPLPTGRQVLPVTRTNREAYLTAFFQWCRSQELDIEGIFEMSWSNIEEINRILVAYGRALYAAGRPHAHYITLNASMQWLTIGLSLDEVFKKPGTLVFRGCVRSRRRTMLRLHFKLFWR